MKVKLRNGVAVDATFAKPVVAQDAPAPAPVDPAVVGTPGGQKPTKYGGLPAAWPGPRAWARPGDRLRE